MVMRFPCESATKNLTEHTFRFNMRKTNQSYTMLKISTLFLISVFASSLPVKACPYWLGLAMLKASWPTPTFTRCEYERTESAGNGIYRILMKTYGNSVVSLLNDKEVWVRVETTVSWKDKKILGFKVRDYKAFVEPQASWKAISEILREINSN